MAVTSKLSKLLWLLFFSLTFQLVQNAFANEQAQVLPEGIYQTQFLFGSVSGVQDRYNSAGLLEGVTAKYHVELNVDTLLRLNSKAKELIETLNTSVPGMNHLGSAVNLGTLDFAANPEVSYFAPVLAYGLSKKVTIAIGAPIIHVKTNVVIKNGGVNNIAAIRRSLQRVDSNGQTIPLDPTLDGYLKQLEAIDPAGEFQKKLAENGYSGTRNYDNTSFGDATLTMLYRYQNTKTWDLALRPYLILPTGRKDDPDDVFDVATGGYQAIGLVSANDYKFNSRWTLGLSAGVKGYLPDHRDVRIPRDEYDYLPTPDRKEYVNRQVGPEMTAEGNIRWQLFRFLTLSSGYELLTKGQDSYSGDRDGYNYALLSRDTNTQTQTARLSLSFSTINWYFQKEFAVPFDVALSYADTFQATNAPNMKIGQLALRGYFK